MTRSHPPRPSAFGTWDLLQAAAAGDRAQRTIPPYYFDRDLDGSQVLETIEPPLQTARWTRSGPTHFSEGSTPEFRAFVADFRRRNA